MKKVNDFWFSAAKLYLYLYGFIKDNFNINIRGYGFILRRVKMDHQLLVNGRHLYFAHERLRLMRDLCKANGMSLKRTI